MADEAGALGPELAAQLKAAAVDAGVVVEPPRAVDEQHPWLGLDSFTEETRGYFYGREAEVAELSRRVQRKLLTILFGQSGLGKTSILRAGIVPKLRPNGYCPVYVRIDYARESPPPSEQIKQAIFRATHEHGEWTQAGSAVEGESLWEFLHHRGDLLKDAQGETVVPLLIFDQFEEIFTLGQADDVGRARAAQFLEDLADLVENRPPKALDARIESDDTLSERFDFARADYRILIALREDYLAHLEGVKAAMPSITQNRMRLARMTGQQALAAVRNPGGKLVSEEVAESIVRFIAGGSELPNAEVEPSLLSLICRELNNTRIAQGRAEISVDLLAGSKENILSEFYERALNDQPAAVRRFIEDEMLTDSGYRESLGEERVRKAFSGAGATPDALAKLVDRRLLRVEERLDLRRVELTHDVLCKVVAESRDLRHAREAQEAAENQLAEQKAREQATRKALVRARQVAAICAVLALGAVASAIFGYESMKRAQSAEAKAQQTRKMAEGARGEAEKLIVYLLDDFYAELSPVGRLDVVAELAKSALSYYRELPAELVTPETERNRALALVRYGAVLGGQAKNDQADASLSEAAKVLDRLRASGDSAEATLLGLARARSAQGWVAASRTNFSETIRLQQEALDILKPVLAQPNPPKAVREIEANALVGLAFGQIRKGVDGGIPSLRQAQKVYRGLNALDLSDLAASSGYAGIGWLLAEAYYKDGRDLEAKTDLDEAFALADRILEVRPGHRPALRAKGLAASWLGGMESRNLRVGAALSRFLETTRILEYQWRLDKTSSSALNNFNISKAGVAFALFRLGRIEESLKYRRESAAVPADARIDAFLASNLAIWNGWLAEAVANDGDMAAARSAMVAARKFEEVANKGSGTNAFNPESVSSSEAVTLLLGDNARAAMTNTQESLARLEAWSPEGKLNQDLRMRSQIRVLQIRSLAANALGDFDAAEAASRRAFDLHQTAVRRGLIDDAAAHENRTTLAKALARLGRTKEAGEILRPALKFYREIQSRGTDDLTIRIQSSHALLVSALVEPAARAAKLNEAAAIMETLPPAMKRWKLHALLIDEIDRERRKG